jgi:hypothetical protein
MTCSRFRHVLALLHDSEPDAWWVLERAVELADAERARLTLAKTTDPGCLVRWFSPLTPLCRLAPLVEPDLGTIAGRRLAQMAETVPATIPLSTVLLPVDTAGALRRLSDSRPFDLVVVAAQPLAHALRLRRELRRLGVSTLAVARDGFPWSAPSLADPLAAGPEISTIDPSLLAPPGLT